MWRRVTDHYEIEEWTEQVLETVAEEVPHTDVAVAAQ